MILLCLGVTFMKAVELMGHHETHVVAKESIGNVPINNAMKSIGTEPLEHEIMFIDTLKDCMPTIKFDEDVDEEEKRKNGGHQKECKTWVPEPEGSKERIAVLAPPGKMTANLLKFIRIVLMKGKKGNDGEIAATQVEVIPDTHMVS